MNQARMRVLVQEPFYQHDHLGPGADLTQITGQGEGDGFYDWAGRRLFLIDGEPDPMCPGAYRYQHNPACCDLEAPDSDPRSPRYEPMHLRHKPGDTWIIDTNRPHDPYDPGPFGSPGWYQDERTGRHRRDETPDPLPAENWDPPKDAWFPGTADWPEPEAPLAESAHPVERSGGNEGDEPPRATGQRGGSDRQPPWGRRGRPVPSEPEEEPEGAQRPWGARTGRPGPGSDATPRTARQFWDHTGRDPGPGDAGWISGYGGTRSDDRGDEPERHDGQGSADTGEYRFSKLREDAFDRFIANSAPLRAAHFAPQKPYMRERAVWVLHWLTWVLALGLVPMPAPLVIRQCEAEPVARQPIPTQPGPVTRLSEDEPTDSRPAHGPWPGAALAAAVAGARIARRVIAERETRSSVDLAAAVRDSASRANAVHWRTAPRQNRPHPVPRPSPGAYMTVWEHAFDSGQTFILGTGPGLGATA
ncbi:MULTISPECIES: hypothetical protein [Glycomyces]|uniref:Uncharacterized protein n=1 Tax=Glycomyces lechevalierae TaxID=256034 RepID=A0A9X3SV66_9ACTN|nr:hypothetical protein [Glycomyces lechevalierae]MDA1384392.1 hypothetical protein [Glycomyces lechevalierae]MDR7339174.1 hypothetical protein [Glycomyces lechevalierae]